MLLENSLVDEVINSITYYSVVCLISVHAIFVMSIYKSLMAIVHVLSNNKRVKL